MVKGLTSSTGNNNTHITVSHEKLKILNFYYRLNLIHMWFKNNLILFISIMISKRHQVEIHINQKVFLLLHHENE